MISFDDALNLVVSHLQPGPVEEVEINNAVGRILAESTRARVDSPTVDVSLKDGYAVRSADLVAASLERSIDLRLLGAQYAGELNGAVLSAGAAIRVTTGAGLPVGADAVISREFAEEKGEIVSCNRDAGPGRNVLFKGTDIQAGMVLAERGQILHPSMIGLLVGAGLDRVRVFKLPRIVVIGTGDEVVSPGRPLRSGQLYASNMVMAAAWLKSLGLTEVSCQVVSDQPESLRKIFSDLMDKVDVLLVSGGSWGGERDFLPAILDELGWQKIYHRVRLGPGKGAGLGFLQGKPIFLLPGGPTSFEIALLLLTIPGLMVLSGRPGPVFPSCLAELTQTISGPPNWTQCQQLRVWNEGARRLAEPVMLKSRLISMASKNALILIPEGVSDLPAGSLVPAIMLAPPLIP